MTICDFLKGQHVGFETLLHRPASSATMFAQSVHVPGRMVAKTVLVRAGSGYAAAVLPATHRIDLDRLAAAIGVDHLEIATEDEVEAVFRDCERGALPPFGRRYGILTVVDAGLAEAGEIAFEGNTRFEGVRMTYRDYEAIEEPRRARFATTIAQKGRPGPGEA